MAEIETQELDKIAEEITDNENSSGDSGIPLSPKDEDPDLDHKDSDSEEKTENIAIADVTNDTVLISPTTDAPIEPDEGDDDPMTGPAEEDEVAKEQNSAEEKSEPKENHNLMTVELAVKQDVRGSPEIVVEPKLLERHSSGRIKPQGNKGVVAVTRAVSVEIKPESLPLRTSKKRSFFKKFKRCLFLISLTAVVIGYAVGGAYLFSHLERKRDIEYNAKIDRWKNDTAILLATELRQVTPHEAVWARKVFHYLEVFEKDLLKASAVGYRRQDHQDREQRWTWTSSLFFSIALMTTTGYGPMTPRSDFGRIAAVFYSAFGIPLAFSWFMLIGHILATFWAALFQNICCRLCHEKSPDHPPKTFSTVVHKQPFKLPKLRSNSVVPTEEQTLISRGSNRLQHSEKVRRSMFPEDTLDEFETGNSHPTKNEIKLRNRMYYLQMEHAQMLDVYHTMDYAVAIIYALLLFVVYYVFFAIFFSVYERWILTDILYFSYLMFMTVGPGCHELEDDSAEIKIKNNLFYIVHLCFGYCILAMILNLVFMMVRGKSDSEKVQRFDVFDSFPREKF